MDGLREYIVVLRKGINYDAFWNQIETASDADGFVTSRQVDGVNESTEWVYIYMRPWAPADNSKYSTSYANEIKAVLLKISD